MTRHRVAVTGLGLIGPYGSDPGASFDRLMAGESAIRPYVPEPSILKTPVPAVVCDWFDAEAALGRTTACMTDRYGGRTPVFHSAPRPRNGSAVRCAGARASAARVQSNWPTSTFCRRGVLAPRRC